MSIPQELLIKCWFLAGPTASGKTAVSLHLAKLINAEIIALDSMTLYRGLDIGTAKVTPAEQGQVPHHLIDIIDPSVEFSLADYLSAAESACREIISRGRIPLFVGGAGLYLRGLLRGVFAGPAADWSVRHRLEHVSLTDGPQALHDRLRQVDEISANRLHPNDQRRVIRALEVFELTGQPLSALQHHGPQPIDQRPANVYWLAPERDWLHRRIDARVEQMFANGLFSEVRELTKRIEPISHTARQALGYKEVIDWFETESTDATRRCGLDDVAIPSINHHMLIELIQTRTRQFAKRQHTWFRNLEECCAIPVSTDDTPEAIADRLARMSEHSPTHLGESARTSSNHAADG